MHFNTGKGGVFDSVRVVAGGMGSFRREGISGLLEGGDAGVGWDVDLLGKPLPGPACTPLLSALLSGRGSDLGSVKHELGSVFLTNLGTAYFFVTQCSHL